MIFFISLWNIFRKGSDIYKHQKAQAYPVNKPISKKTQEALDKIAGKVVIGTLSAGNTSVTLNDPAIKDSSTVDFYTSIYGVSPTSVLIAEGRITLDFEAQESDMNVKVVIS